MTDTPDTTAFNASVARTAVAGYDDMQDVRTAMMNRVRDIIRKKNENIPFDQVEDEKDPDDRTYDDKYRDDNLRTILNNLIDEDKVTDDEARYIKDMLDAAEQAVELEEKYSDLMDVATNETIYKDYLQHVYGVSGTLAAKLLHSIGYCKDFDRVSQLWSYAGLAPGKQRVKGEQLSHDPQLKKRAWLVADCMIKSGSRSLYRREFYDPYKNEQLYRMNQSACRYCGEPTVNHYSPNGSNTHYCSKDKDQEVDLGDFELPDDVSDDATPPWSKGHADNRARRYLAKKFLKHYWAIARDIKDLDVPDEYVLTHGGHEKGTETFENPFYMLQQLQTR